MSKRSQKQKQLHALLNGGWDPDNKEAAFYKLALMTDLATGLRPENPLLAQLEIARAKILGHFKDFSQGT